MQRQHLVLVLVVSSKYFMIRRVRERVGPKIMVDANEDFGFGFGVGGYHRETQREIRERRVCDLFYFCRGFGIAVDCCCCFDGPTKAVLVDRF